MLAKPKNFEVSIMVQFIPAISTLVKSYNIPQLFNPNDYQKIKQTLLYIIQGENPKIQILSITYPFWPPRGYMTKLQMAF